MSVCSRGIVIKNQEQKSQGEGGGKREWRSREEARGREEGKEEKVGAEGAGRGRRGKKRILETHSLDAQYLLSEALGRRQADRSVEKHPV